MQLKTLLLGGMALAIGANADKMMTTTSCPWSGGCSSSGEWHNNGDEKFWVDANTGCRRPNIPAFNELCMDWVNMRGHFLVQGQNRRCISRQGADFDVGPCADTSKKCSRQWWYEVPCTW